MEDALELASFQWAMNRFPTDLLPPGSSLFITHDEVLIVNAREVKVQHSSIHCRFPHQTGVTERSIGGHDRRPANRVLHHVMIAHEPDRIGYGLFADDDSQYSIIIVDEVRLSRFNVRRIR